MDYETQKYGRTDHRNDQGARGWCESIGFVPQVRHQRSNILQFKAKLSGMTVSDAKKLRALEEENGRLKRLLADPMLDNAALKDLATKTSNAQC